MEEYTKLKEKYDEMISYCKYLDGYIDGMKYILELGERNDK